MDIWIFCVFPRGGNLIISSISLNSSKKFKKIKKCTFNTKNKFLKKSKFRPKIPVSPPLNYLSQLWRNFLYVYITWHGITFDFSLSHFYAHFVVAAAACSPNCQPGLHNFLSKRDKILFFGAEERKVCKKFSEKEFLISPLAQCHPESSQRRCLNFFNSALFRFKVPQLERELHLHNSSCKTRLNPPCRCF